MGEASGVADGRYAGIGAGAGGREGQDVGADAVAAAGVSGQGDVVVTGRVGGEVEPVVVVAVIVGPTGVGDEVAILSRGCRR